MRKKLVVVGTVLTLTFSGLGYVGTVNAETNISDQKDKVSEKLNDVETDILNSTKQINEINLDIDSLEGALISNEQEIERMNKETKTYEKEIKTLEEEIEVLNEEIEARNEILKERLSSYQNSGGDVGYMEVIFGSKGFDEFISRFTAVTTITKADNKLIEEQKTAINKVEQKESQVKEKLSETEKNKENLKKINKEQKIQKKEMKESKKSVESKISDLEDKKAAYIAEGNDLEALENQIEEEIRESEVGISEATETITSDNSEEETTTEQVVEEDSNDSDNSNNNSNETDDNDTSNVTNTSTTTNNTSNNSSSTNDSTNNSNNGSSSASNSSNSSSSVSSSNNTSSNNTSSTSSSNNSSNNNESSASSSNNSSNNNASSTSSSNNTSSNNTSSTNNSSNTNTPSNTKPKPKPAPKPSTGNGVISDAHSLKGISYQWGGTTTSGFDCSGYTSFVYKKNGINLPRTAAAQYAAYPKVSKSSIRAGDLVFFSSSPGGGSITHVGISLGGTQYIGSQSSTGVAVTSFSSGYWGDRYVGAARPN